MTDSFPRQQARTRRFTLGAPRAFQVSPDGARVAFLRSKGGDDPVTCLWEADAATGAERLVADPAALGAEEENLPPEERARRERVRETAAGIVSYATDAAQHLAVFALSGQVYAAPLGEAQAPPRAVPARAPALDPRPDPAGRKVAYVHEGAVRVIELATGQDRLVAGADGDGDGVTFGLAEFVAAEEMGRARGYWWSPDGSRLLIARVDESPVQRWHIADPANPGRAPAAVGYPAAGTANAAVSLIIAPADGAAPGGAGAPAAAIAAGWDPRELPYLVAACWDADLLIVVQSRDQKTMRVIDAATGEVIREDTDPHWTDIVDGVPAQLSDGRVVWTQVSEDTRRLIVAPAAELATAAPVTPPGLQVREILGTDGQAVLLLGSTEATEVGVWRYSPDGLAAVATAPGLHSAREAGGTTVVSGRTLEGNQLSVRINRNEKTTGQIASLAQEPNLPRPRPHFLDAGPAAVRTAVLFPSWHEPGTRLPVLMDPYGGPHAQRVVKSAGAFLTSQWFAEQGFAVVVADGRGTPGRGPAWERAVAGDLATGILADQVTALHAAAAAFPDLDAHRVGIRGWSFGGYLAALAVLRRPDVFHAAVAGAPVTDWRLYDTHYTERYLGDPADNPAGYEVSSLTSDPERAVASVTRPLLIIHGLADDNVFVAHSLRLSSALLAAGYPHSVLPLSGVTHMTPQEVVAENLLLLQVEFLRSALSGGGGM
ncbi:S9 family peptidase [Trebonia sp.]|uniref:S9 family peptidase n=1 Tax=Trebonia sp. TaxID=2767075 RepID=UPI002617518F|nr:S9 family peptidase [Trebonia sp.]